MTGWLAILKEAFSDFSDDDCSTMAAALSYYTVFSIPPLLLLILTVASMFFEPQQVRETLSSQLGSLMGSAGREEAMTIFQSAEQQKSSHGIAAVLGIVALIFGATGAFAQLQAALNRAWEVAPDPDRGGLKNFIMKRVLSFGMILGIAFLLLVSLALSAALSALGDALARAVPGLGTVLLHAINLGISLVVITLLFAAIFKILPDAEIGWRDVWVGATVTGLLFVIGKFLLGLYLGRSNPGEAFGAAGSLAVMLVWIYYSSMILLFGAEFTQRWAESRGGGISPEPGAVRLVEEKRPAREGEAG